MSRRRTENTDKYIIRKSAHRLHPHLKVRDINGYCGKLCFFAGVKPLDLYTSLDAAVADARRLYAQEPYGWDVYLVGSCPPLIAATVSAVEKAT